jgi:hypothetical protein
MIVDDIQDDAETEAVSSIHKVAERIRYPVKPCWSEEVDTQQIKFASVFRHTKGSYARAVSSWYPAASAFDV